MRRKLTELFHFARTIQRSRRRWMVLTAFGVCLVPATAMAGMGDILSLLQTITSTIQGAIGGALSDIQRVETLLIHYRQEIIWPLAALNQTKSFVSSIRSQYGHLMFGIVNVRNNSATLVPPAQLESLFRGGQSGSLGQLQPAYFSVYTAVPNPSNANLVQRNMMDMDDALAMGSLKTTVLSDQTTQSVLTMADSIEQQSADGAPGSGPMIATQAQIAELETQALMAKVLASELRAEAAKLAHENAWFKQSSASVQNLQNQLQQVFSQP